MVLIACSISKSGEEYNRQRKQVVPELKKLEVEFGERLIQSSARLALVSSLGFTDKEVEATDLVSDGVLKQE